MISTFLFLCHYTRTRPATTYDQHTNVPHTTSFHPSFAFTWVRITYQLHFPAPPLYHLPAAQDCHSKYDLYTKMSAMTHRSIILLVNRQRIEYVEGPN